MNERPGEKILILGCPGSGKSYFAVKLAALTGLPLFHLDNIWWRADGTHLSREEFDEKLAALLSLERWIIDGDYSRTYETRICVCYTVFFLDFDTGTCVEGITGRIGKERPDIPWVEKSPDPELLRMVRNYGEENRPVVLSLLGKYPGKRVFVFRSRDESDLWLSEFAGKGGF